MLIFQLTMLKRFLEILPISSKAKAKVHKRDTEYSSNYYYY